MCRCWCSPYGGIGITTTERLELGAARVMSKDAPVEEILATIRGFGGLEAD